MDNDSLNHLGQNSKVYDHDHEEEISLNQLGNKLVIETGPKQEKDISKIRLSHKQSSLILLGGKTTKNSLNKIGNMSSDFSSSDRSQNEENSDTSSDYEQKEDNKFKYFF